MAKQTGFEYTQKDVLKKLMKVKGRVSGSHVAVGFPVKSLEHYPKAPDVSVAQVAFYQEFGTKRNSPTAFFSEAINEYKSSGEANRKKLARKVQTARVSPKQALDFIGVEAVNGIVGSIDKHGLIDTGLMKQSATHEVRK